jgi:hypothetical protein
MSKAAPLLTPDPMNLTNNEDLISEVPKALYLHAKLTEHLEPL